MLLLPVVNVTELYTRNAASTTCTVELSVVGSKYVFYYHLKEKKSTKT